MRESGIFLTHLLRFATLPIDTQAVYYLGMRQKEAILLDSVDLVQP